MVALRHIEKLGNQLIAVFDDGSRVMAIPTPNKIWVVNGKTVEPPAPAPQPSTGAFMFPFPLSTVVSEFGPRVSPGGIGSTDHKGIDFSGGAASGGNAIPASGAGVVEFNDWGGGFGWLMTINHGTVNGKTVKTLYTHRMVKEGPVKGSVIAKGDSCGRVGSTGRATGDNMHWETIVNGVQINPRLFIEEFG